MVNICNCNVVLMLLNVYEDGAQRNLMSNNEAKTIPFSRIILKGNHCHSLADTYITKISATFSAQVFVRSCLPIKFEPFTYSMHSVNLYGFSSN